MEEMEKLQPEGAGRRISHVLVMFRLQNTSLVSFLVADRKETDSRSPGGRTVVWCLF